MKQLKDYIYERQEINEAGLRDTLFGEIVMKILGTGLDWIGKAGSWVADSLKGAVSTGWNTLGGLSKDVWYRWSKDHGYRDFNYPKNEKSFMKFVNDRFVSNTDESLDDRLDALLDLCKRANGSGDVYAQMALPVLVAHAENKNATQEDVKEALAYLNKLLNEKSVKAATKKKIKDAINKINSKNKQDKKDDDKE